MMNAWYTQFKCFIRMNARTQKNFFFWLYQPYSRQFCWSISYFFHYIECIVQFVNNTCTLSTCSVFVLILVEFVSLFSSLIICNRFEKWKKNIFSNRYYRFMYWMVWDNYFNWNISNGFFSALFAIPSNHYSVSNTICHRCQATLNTVREREKGKKWSETIEYQANKKNEWMKKQSVWITVLIIIDSIHQKKHEKWWNNFGMKTTKQYKLQ